MFDESEHALLSATVTGNNHDRHEKLNNWRAVHEAMPKGIRDFGDDVEKKIRQVLQAQLTRMDLVNREEFDVQTRFCCARVKTGGAGAASGEAGK